MASLILRDSARGQTSDAERRNRQGQRAGEDPQVALYSPEHAEAITQRVQPVPDQQLVTVAPGIHAI